MTDSKPIILVVDDTPPSLFVLAAVLNEFGFDPRPVTNGEAALRAARIEPPDLVLLDINMPHMDGFEVCRRFKADPTLCEIPVIFISAYGEMEDKVTAFAAGGVDYVTKPFHAEEVRARISVHLELRRKERELERSNAQLRQMEAARDALVHMIVHDLRAPLNGIHGFLDLVMARGADQIPQHLSEMLEEVQRSSRRMIQMVSDILDVSKAETSELQLVLEPHDISVVARDVLRQLASLVEDKKVVIEAPPGPTEAIFDRDLIWRVIENLFINALRYTKRDGEVRISIEAGPNLVKVSIGDQGPGVPLEYRERIFEKFGQVEPRAVGRSLSTGLGLAFCKMVVLSHGGRIGVESAVDRGSVFWFELPTTEPDRASGVGVLSGE